MKNRFNPSKPYDSLPPLPPPREAAETLSVLRKEAAARQALLRTERHCEYNPEPGDFD
jgi:hypothetical protein